MSSRLLCHIPSKASNKCRTPGRAVIHVFWLRTRDKLPTPMGRKKERTRKKKQASTLILLCLPQFPEKTGAQMCRRDSDMSEQGREGIINKKNICIRLIGWHCYLNGMPIIVWITVVIHGLERWKFFEPRGSHLSQKDTDKDEPPALRHLTTML